MQFYKYEGVMVDDKWAEDEDSHNKSKMIKNEIRYQTKSFNHLQNSKGFLSVAEVYGDAVIVGIIAENHSADASDMVHKYLRSIGLELKDKYLEEITLKDFVGLLNCADRNNYIYDSDDVLDQFDLETLADKYGRNFDFGECIVCDDEKRDIYEEAKRLLAADTLIPELERICAGNRQKKVSGHPVHYMIQTDSRWVSEDMCSLLIQTLNANQRLRSRRYSYVDFKSGEDFSRLQLESLYKSNIGGTVAIRFLVHDDAEDDHANNDIYTIETICEVMKKYRNQVLTVFCLPRECTHAKDIFYENLGTARIVELKEELAYGERAEEFLKRLAKDNGIRSDKKLYAKLEEDTGYLASELHELFEEWFDNKLKDTVFPQYKDISTVKSEVIKAAPKGSAYDELNQMIGLDEAKKVINRALNYYKAQKLFAEKGMKTDHVSMHMVFTGNPGTAKTTVARLFARILKENNILSNGKLIEVGRGDLVGKYVGWTANIVKKKFKEARGSVLFIDEAYSLVDDRDGSFGDEAINTIVQEMENHRDDVVVIFAGYPDKMEGFLQKNPGLRSRIAYHVPFDDYDTESLCKIAKLIAKQKGLSLTEDACDKLTFIFEKARTESDFGNGRYVRNVIENARMAHASRLLDMDFDTVKRADVITICARDIETPRTDREIRHIGFI